jgi:hypothetical protein
MRRRGFLQLLTATAALPAQKALAAGGTARVIDVGRRDYGRLYHLAL